MGFFPIQIAISKTYLLKLGNGIIVIDDSFGNINGINRKKGNKTN
jgi:hypothetical protein